MLTVDIKRLLSKIGLTSRPEWTLVKPVPAPVKEAKLTKRIPRPQPRREWATFSRVAGREAAATRFGVTVYDIDRARKLYRI